MLNKFACNIWNIISAFRRDNRCMPKDIQEKYMYQGSSGERLLLK